MADEKKAEAKAPKAELTPEEQAAQAKKKKLIIMIAAAVVGLGGIGGGLAVFLGGGEKKAEPSAEGEHGEKKEAEHGEKKDEHGEKKDEHGEKKAAEHGEKKEGGEKTEGEHGEKKAAEHGEKKEGGEHGEAPKKDDKKDAKNTKLDGVDFGCTLPLTPFHLNLGNPLENRYVRLEISLEYGCADEAKAEIEKRMPQLRDAIITVASRKTREFLLGPDGKEQLRKEIHNRVNHYMTAKVDDVFITDILIE